MADKLNYQQARQIRKTKFSDLFLDTLAQKDKGVIGSVGKAISLRSQARIKGIKEKFDPLNIVKFLTFGSKLGPALYGKMAGRDQKDIDYFTGRSRHVTGGRNTADKIKGKGGDGDNEGINEQLAKIFTFLKSNREDDVKLKEQAKNHEEEINMEKDRRHKELVKTLEKLMKQIGGGTATATKAEDRSFLDGILASIQAMKDKLSDFMSLLGGLDKLKWLGKFAMNPAVLVTMGLAMAIWYLIQENINEAKQRDSAAAVGNLQELRKRVEAQGPDEGGDLETVDEKMKRLLKVANTKESLAALATMENGTEQIDKTTDSYRERFNQSLLQQGYKKNLFTPGYNKSGADPTPEALAIADAFASGKKLPSATPVQPAPVPSNPATNETTVPPPSDGSTVSPVPATPPSAPVSNLTNTNVELNLPSNNSGNSVADATKRNITALNSRNKERSGLTPSQISVRNEEPTYNELIAASTRMI